MNKEHPLRLHSILNFRKSCYGFRLHTTDSIIAFIKIIERAILGEHYQKIVAVELH